MVAPRLIRLRRCSPGEEVVGIACRKVGMFPERSRAGLYHIKSNIKGTVSDSQRMIVAKGLPVWVGTVSHIAQRPGGMRALRGSDASAKRSPRSRASLRLRLRTVERQGPMCQSVVAAPVDQLMEGLIFQSIQPAALELSLKAGEAKERDRQQLHEQWQKKLQRAGYGKRNSPSGVTKASIRKNRLWPARLNEPGKTR